MEDPDYEIASIEHCIEHYFLGKYTSLIGNSKCQIFNGNLELNPYSFLDWENKKFDRIFHQRETFLLLLKLDHSYYINDILIEYRENIEAKDILKDISHILMKNYSSEE